MRTWASDVLTLHRGDFSAAAGDSRPTRVGPSRSGPPATTCWTAPRESVPGVARPARRRRGRRRTGADGIQLRRRVSGVEHRPGRGVPCELRHDDSHGHRAGRLRRVHTARKRARTCAPLQERATSSWFTAARHRPSTMPWMRLPSSRQCDPGVCAERRGWACRRRFNCRRLRGSFRRGRRGSGGRVLDAKLDIVYKQSDSSGAQAPAVDRRLRRKLLGSVCPTSRSLHQGEAR